MTEENSGMIGVKYKMQNLSKICKISSITYRDVEVKLLRNFLNEYLIVPLSSPVTAIFSVIGIIQLTACFSLSKPGNSSFHDVN